MATPIVVNAEVVKTSSSNPPPNVLDGGVWGTVSYIGDKTRVAACVGCLCFCLPGCLILCCPFVSEVEWELILKDSIVAQAFVLTL